MKTFNIVERNDITTSYPSIKKIVGNAKGQKEAQQMVDVLTNDNICFVNKAVPFVPYHMRTHAKKLEFPLKKYSFEVSNNI